jgi:tripartite-type tricarboxylate transporter receptor subunit TctC
MQQGECNYQPGAWNSWKARRGDWLKQGLIKPMAITALTRHPDLPDTPTIVELAKNDTDRDIMKFIAGYAAVGRAYSAPPGTPKDRVAALRKAFDGMVNDPVFIADAKKRKMLLGPGTGAEVQKVVDDIISTPEAVVLNARKMLGYK